MDFTSLTPVDSWGVPISSYVLSFNRGNPLAWGEANFVDLMFGVYKAIAWLSLMLLNVVASFDWLRLFVDLLERVSDSITGVFGSAGVLLMALGVAMAAAAVNWMRRNNHRSLYHLALALLLMMVATAMVSPTRMAGELLGVGRDVGTQVGTSATGTPRGATLSQILADKLVREPTQRWNYSHDLDSLGCGDTWTSYVNAAAAHQSGFSVDKVKDAANACGNYGTYLHAYAMNPDNAVFDGVFALGCIIVFAFFSGVMWMRMLRTGFATVLHGSAIKPTMYFVPAGAAAQSLFVRNGLAAGIGAGTICLDIIVYIIGASFTAAMATITGSGLTASIITASAMIGIVLGSRQFIKNLRPTARQVASKITHSQGPPPMLPPALSSPNLATTLMLASSPAIRALHPALAPLALTGSTARHRTSNPSPPQRTQSSPDRSDAEPSSAQASRAAADATAPQPHTASRQLPPPAALPDPPALPARHNQQPIPAHAVINAAHAASSSKVTTPRPPTPVPSPRAQHRELLTDRHGRLTHAGRAVAGSRPARAATPPAPIPSHPALPSDTTDNAARAANDAHRSGPRRDSGAP
jgi:hypothetical protein